MYYLFSDSIYQLSEMPMDNSEELKQTSYFKPFQCIFCNMRFNSNQILEVHILAVHLHKTNMPLCKNKELFKCEICQIHFIMKQNLTFHMLTTHAEQQNSSFSLDQQNSVLEEKIRNGAKIKIAFESAVSNMKLKLTEDGNKI